MKTSPKNKKNFNHLKRSKPTSDPDLDLCALDQLLEDSKHIDSMIGASKQLKQNRGNKVKSKKYSSVAKPVLIKLVRLKTKIYVDKPYNFLVRDHESIKSHVMSLKSLKPGKKNKLSDLYSNKHDSNGNLDDSLDMVQDIFSLVNSLKKDNPTALSQTSNPLAFKPPNYMFHKFSDLVSEFEQELRTVTTKPL